MESQQALSDFVTDLRSRQAADLAKQSDGDAVKLVKGAIIVVGIVVVVGLLSMASGGKQTSDSGSSATPSVSTVRHYNPTETDAIYYAKQFVTRQLKAPSTAKFPWTDYKVTKMSFGRWRVSSYVDAQNGFGAMLRSQWTVEMENTGSTWELVSCSID